MPFGRDGAPPGHCIALHGDVPALGITPPHGIPPPPHGIELLLHGVAEDHEDIGDAGDMGDMGDIGDIGDIGLDQPPNGELPGIGKPLLATDSGDQPPPSFAPRNFLPFSTSPIASIAPIIASTIASPRLDNWAEVAARGTRTAMSSAAVSVRVFMTLSQCGTRVMGRASPGVSFAR
jgi:hypothetical protein